MGRARARSVPLLGNFSALALPAGREARRPSRAARDAPHHAQRAVLVAGFVMARGQRMNLNHRNVEDCWLREDARAEGLPSCHTARRPGRDAGFLVERDVGGELLAGRAPPGQRRNQAKAACMHAHDPSTRQHGPAVTAATASGSPPSRAERGAPRRGTDAWQPARRYRRREPNDSAPCATPRTPSASFPPWRDTALGCCALP